MDIIVTTSTGVGSSDDKLHAFPFVPGVGIGVKYSSPSTLPATGAIQYKIASKKQESTNVFDVLVGNNGAPYVEAWAFIPSVGWGSKYSNPATPVSGSPGRGASINNAGSVAAISTINTPRISAYQWSSGFGSKFSDPLTVATWSGVCNAFSTSDSVLFLGGGSTGSRILAYQWDNASGFGTTYSNPSTLPTSTVQNIAVHPSGSAVITAHNTTPFVSAYPWNDSTGFGAKFSNPLTLPGSSGEDVAFSRSGNSVAVAYQSSSPYVSAYPWSNSTGFGAKFSNPLTLPTDALSIKFSQTVDIVLVGHRSPTGSDNSFSIYDWNDSTGFGAKYSDPSPVFGSNASFGVTIAEQSLTRRVFSIT